MKAIAYSINVNEKEHLVRSNAKTHDLTLISNELNASTLSYCGGKTVIIVSGRDIVDQALLRSLKQMGVRYIVTRSKTTTHIDLQSAAQLGIKVANNASDDQSIENTAKQTIRNLDLWEAGRCVGHSCCCYDCNNVKNNSSSKV
ncbi:lactate dehydrogenase [Olivibacter sp. XZL3]|uniref:lactate dehydrogenase n=1 Tax=Olivibacter sp. XZL3 TaxID=1735116 RepID=UPI001066B052|nr:lactate dehydrogenase [Olivibacter sp. XZL3]